MGYYARARNLHRAAKILVEQFRAEFPQTTEGLMSLPGIGPYTAAAMLSIAFDRPVPALDANAKRVISRMVALKVPLKSSQATREVRRVARELLPREEAGNFNQALMDLGATICTSKKPRCPDCPLQGLCEARARQMEQVLPITNKGRPIAHHDVTAGLIRDRYRRMLITQRPNRGLLGGLWKFPGGRQRPGESLKACLRRAIQEEVGVRVHLGKTAGSIKHAYSHFRMTLHVFRCSRRDGTPTALGCQDWCWVRPDGLQDFAFSKVDQKVIEDLL